MVNKVKVILVTSLSLIASTLTAFSGKFGRKCLRESLDAQACIFEGRHLAYEKNALRIVSAYRMASYDYACKSSLPSPRNSDGQSILKHTSQMVAYIFIAPCRICFKIRICWDCSKNSARRCWIGRLQTRELGIAAAKLPVIAPEFAHIPPLFTTSQEREWADTGWRTRLRRVGCGQLFASKQPSIRALSQVGPQGCITAVSPQVRITKGTHPLIRACSQQPLQFPEWETDPIVAEVPSKPINRFGPPLSMLWLA
ncbi:hypothetical protein B0H16DRAFT_1700083 [Mycena metata]|uniref:Uncharacterized protein n=1 Tax=Mycena metata TaxID=1033252 RepID=A0AAD7HG05_9AGAR|nr:hypothetical protein B0H16DRAFT_1700083 [Mycena metata]